MKKRLLALIACIALLGSLAACNSGGGGEGEAAADYPSRTITLIVPFNAGGGTDLTARALAAAMEKDLGVPVAVVNKPGASATIGITELSNAAPDGYTFGIVTYGAVTQLPHTNDLTYDVDSFDYLGTMARYEYGLIVRADSPYENVADLVEAAEATGGMNIPGAALPHPLVADALSEATGLDFRWVNTDSSPESITQLLGGHVEAVSISMDGAIPYLESGECRLIASGLDRRFDYAPDVPTYIEQGYDLELISYIGYALPAGVDEAVYNTILESFNKCLADESVVTAATNLKLNLTNLSGEEYKAALTEGFEFYGEYFANQE